MKIRVLLVVGHRLPRETLRARLADSRAPIIGFPLPVITEFPDFPHAVAQAY